MASGKIYVFDLDETLISSNKGEIVPNISILRRIYEAVQLRNSNKGVDAILLLTNNMNLQQKRYASGIVEYEGGFVTQALMKLVDEYNKICNEKESAKITNGGEIFDIVYTAEQKFFNSGKRTRKQVRTKFAEPVKDIATVKNMIDDFNTRSEKQISTENLESRIFYFDDDGSHVLRGEIEKSGFVLMNPRFGTGNNATNFSSVNKFHLRGGYSKRKRRTKYRQTRKN